MVYPTRIKILQIAYRNVFTLINSSAKFVRWNKSEENHPTSRPGSRVGPRFRQASRSNLRVIEWYQHRQNCLVFASNMTDFSVNYLRNHSEQRSIFYFEYLGKVWISRTLKRHFIPRRLLRIKHWHLVSSVRCLGVISEHQVRVRVWRPKPEAQNTSFPNSQCVGRSVGQGFHEERGLVKGEISENLWVRGKMGHFCFSLCKNS